MCKEPITLGQLNNLDVCLWMPKRIYIPLEIQIQTWCGNTLFPKLDQTMVNSKTVKCSKKASTWDFVESPTQVETQYNASAQIWLHTCGLLMNPMLKHFHMMLSTAAMLYQSSDGISSASSRNICKDGVLEQLIYHLCTHSVTQNVHQDFPARLQ